MEMLLRTTSGECMKPQLKCATSPRQNSHTLGSDRLQSEICLILISPFVEKGLRSKRGLEIGNPLL
jgi:hypothetical protein